MKKPEYQKVENPGNNENEPFDDTPQAFEQGFDDSSDNDDIIPASMFFPARKNILKDGQMINFGDNLDDPCATIFAFRLFEYRINIQRCECFQILLGLALLGFFLVVILIEIFKKKD